jgi:tetratricopeptide (TPR) repeat protein
MGRTKGSKNGVRKVPIKKTKLQKLQEAIQAETENFDPNRPIFNTNVLNSYKNRRYGKCIELIQKILDNNSDDDKDHYKILLAASLVMLKVEINKAHSILDEVLQTTQANADALYVRGVAFYFEGRFDESVAAFDKALEVNSGPEMNRARDMKIRIDLERRKAVISIEKMVDHQTKIEKDLKETQTEDEEPIVDAGGIEEIADIIGADIKESIENLSVSNEGTIKPLNSGAISSTTAPNTPIPDIPESLPKSFKPQTAEEFYQKGMELYMCGSLKKSLKMFDKSVQIDASFTKSEDMGAKAQEFLELIDTATINMELKNYPAVVEIINEALEVDKTNLYINRPFYFQRGLALFHMGKNEESMKDYAQYDKINKALNED